MPGAWWSKVGLVVAVTLIACLSLVPSLYPVPPEHRSQPADYWPGWVNAIANATGNAKITLGLDLQGGLHLQYRVDVDKAISDKVGQFSAEITRQIRASHPDVEFTVERIEGAPALRVTAVGVNPSDMITDDALLAMNLNLMREGANSVRLEVDSQYIEDTKDYAIEQAISTIEARVNDTGVAEPSISRRGTTDIIVQLPGLDESEFERMKTLISQTAQLVFHMVADDDATFFTTLVPPEGFTRAAGRPQGPSVEAVRQLVRDMSPPPGTEIAFLESKGINPVSGQFEVLGYQPILLRAETSLTGEFVTDARTGTDPQTNRPVVNITFDSEGTRVFGRLTQENVGQQMAIKLDDRVMSAPTINEPILGGRCQITLGGGSYQESVLEAQALAVVLRNGALPAPIEKQFETQVGPSLGAESVAAGRVALIVAFFFVVAFVIAYYRVAGLITSAALALNIVFIGSALALLHATLTLPGIAGIVLIIGMAVDANVIVFERIKEELQLGKTARTAVSSGYEKAFSAVIDANITSALAALVLMEYGSGPVRGFAVTLLIGIACSLFTALFVTRLMFDYLLDGAKLKRLSI